MNKGKKKGRGVVALAQRGAQKDTGWNTQHSWLRHPISGEGATVVVSHTNAGRGAPTMGRADAGSATIAVMSSTTVTSIIKRLMRHLLIPTLPTGAACA